MTMDELIRVWWAFITSLAWLTCIRGEICYSLQSGTIDCWNGCCGPRGDEDCCSSTVLILGLGLGGAVVLLAVVVVVVCWTCKDCRPKTCCCCCCGEQGENGQHSHRRSRGHRGGRGGRSRRVVVHPVAPPDYTTATQERAPSVQPGFSRRTIPLSPPPPYIETVPPPPTPVPPAPSQQYPNTSRSESSTISTAAVPPGVVLVTAHVPHTSDERVDSGHFVGQLSSGNTSAFGASASTSVDTTSQQQVPGINSAFVAQSLGTGRNRNSSASGSSTHSSSVTSSRPADYSHRPTSRAGDTAPVVLPSTDRATNGAIKSTRLVQVKETPRSGESRNNSERAAGSSQQTGHDRRSVAHSTNSPGRRQQHSMSPSANNVDQLDLI